MIFGQFQSYCIFFCMFKATSITLIISITNSTLTLKTYDEFPTLHINPTFTCKKHNKSWEHCKKVSSGTLYMHFKSSVNAKNHHWAACYRTTFVSQTKRNNKWQVLKAHINICDNWNEWFYRRRKKELVFLDMIGIAR